MEDRWDHSASRATVRRSRPFSDETSILLRWTASKNQKTNWIAESNNKNVASWISAFRNNVPQYNNKEQSILVGSPETGNHFASSGLQHVGHTLLHSFAFGNHVSILFRSWKAGRLLSFPCRIGGNQKAKRYKYLLYGRVGWTNVPTPGGRQNQSVTGKLFFPSNKDFYSTSTTAKLDSFDPQ